MDQVHELETKAGEECLSKEEFYSIVNECDKLTAQYNEKWEAVKKLEEQWKKAEDEEIKKLEEEYKKLEE